MTVSEDVVIATAVMLTFLGVALPAGWAIVALVARWWREAQGFAGWGMRRATPEVRPESRVVGGPFDEVMVFQDGLVVKGRIHPTANPDLDFVEVDAETWLRIHTMSVRFARPVEVCVYAPDAVRLVRERGGVTRAWYGPEGSQQRDVAVTLDEVMTRPSPSVRVHLSSRSTRGGA